MSEQDKAAMLAGLKSANALRAAPAVDPNVVAEHRHLHNELVRLARVLRDAVTTTFSDDDADEDYDGVVISTEDRDNLVDTVAKLASEWQMMYDMLLQVASGPPPALVRPLGVKALVGLDGKPLNSGG